MAFKIPRGQPITVTQGEKVLSIRAKIAGFEILRVNNLFVLKGYGIESCEQDLFEAIAWLEGFMSNVLVRRIAKSLRCNHIMAGTLNEKCWLQSGHEGNHIRSPEPDQEWGF